MLKHGFFAVRDEKTAILYEVTDVPISTGNPRKDSVALLLGCLRKDPAVLAHVKIHTHLDIMRRLAVSGRMF